ncbi:MAG: hypothetical protein RLZZ303_934 [Candidatus Hydrogenedentota bacterium]
MSSRISVRQDVCHGQACVHGTRVPVHQVLRMLAAGDSIDTLLDAYPSLTRDDVLACIDYGASLAEDSVTPIEALSNSA